MGRRGKKHTAGVEKNQWVGTGKKAIVNNRKTKDNGAKLIFDDPILCAEFLRGYTDIELLKDVQPEDIEDISERFLPMWQEGRDSDSVKKVRIKDTSLFLITIIEHQSEIYYDMPLKILRYIVMVLTDYEREQEKLKSGSTKRKDFKYPPILPIIYYEGKSQWTAARNFKDRVYFSDTLGKYIPDFEYIVVPISQYTNQEIIDRQDELSLLMLINKLKSSEDFKHLKEIPSEYFENLEANTPEYLLNLISKIVAVFLYRLNVPQEEVENFTDQIKRREFSMLFDSFEAYDVQETRRISREMGREEGKKEREIELICKKLQKGKSEEQIADDLEEELLVIQEICKIAAAYAPDYDTEKIYKAWQEITQEDKDASKNKCRRI